MPTLVDTPTASSQTGDLIMARAENTKAAYDRPLDRPLTPSASPRTYPVQLAQDLLDSVNKWKKLGSTEQSEADLAEEARQAQYERMRNATTAREWKHAADRLDILEGNHWWKFDEGSDECNMALIRKRLDRLKQANHDGDVDAMLTEVRSALARDLGRMCDRSLYKHTWSGTKALIDEYTEVVRYTIDQIVKSCEFAPSEEIERFLHEMKAARQAFGNSALLLSGGGTLGMLHIGVVKCLVEEGLLPRIVCGSSAGSIVGSVLCTHRGDEIISKLDELCRGDLTVFQGVDEWQGIPGMAINLLKGDPIFHINNLCRVMKGLLGEITFREAYNHTGRILNIHVSCQDKYNLPRLLNYQTAPNVIVWTAVASSCAVPCVFEAPGLKAKNPETGEAEPWGHIDHKWIDGSIEGDLPTQIMERLFNVNNFIVSQCNPHVQMFLPKDEDVPANPAAPPSSTGTLFRTLLNVTKANLVYILDNIVDHGWDPVPVKMLHSILSQKYDGDITILPDISWVSWPKVLANPTHEFMVKATRAGEAATWPKLDRIRNHVAIELALDRAIKQIQALRFTAGALTDGASATRRGLSSSRSERAFTGLTGTPSILRSQTGDAPPLPLPFPRATARGRLDLQHPVRSMIEPLSMTNRDLDLTAFDYHRLMHRPRQLRPAHKRSHSSNLLSTSSTAQHITGNPLISSPSEAEPNELDDTPHSGESSPVTLYDDEDDFTDLPHYHPIAPAHPSRPVSAHSSANTTRPPSSSAALPHRDSEGYFAHSPPPAAHTPVEPFNFKAGGMGSSLSLSSTAPYSTSTAPHQAESPAISPTTSRFHHLNHHHHHSRHPPRSRGASISSQSRTPRVPSTPNLTLPSSPATAPAAPKPSTSSPSSATPAPASQPVWKRVVTGLQMSAIHGNGGAHTSDHAGAGVGHTVRSGSIEGRKRHR